MLRRALIAAMIAAITDIAFAEEPSNFPLSDSIPVSTPIDEGVAPAKGGDIALSSVFRVICPAVNSGGTGFLHKSGNVITAAHVVVGCTDLLIITADNKHIAAITLNMDLKLDLALVQPKDAITATTLTISSAPEQDIKVGTQVSTWGFPGGYGGLSPMLSVGYLSGIQAVRTPTGGIERQWVVNAAFNRGNSGGPLLSTQTGEVIGVVDSKAAPIPDAIRGAMKALGTNQNGLQFNATMGDGSQRSFSESQIVEAVLEELTNEVQLVIGNAIMASDIRSFLTANKIDP